MKIHGYDDFDNNNNQKYSYCDIKRNIPMWLYKIFCSHGLYVTQRNDLMLYESFECVFFIMYYLLANVFHVIPSFFTFFKLNIKDVAEAAAAEVWSIMTFFKIKIQLTKWNKEFKRYFIVVRCILIVNQFITNRIFVFQKKTKKFE